MLSGQGEALVMDRFPLALLLQTLHSRHRAIEAALAVDEAGVGEAPTGTVEEGAVGTMMIETIVTLEAGPRKGAGDGMTIVTCTDIGKAIVGIPEIHATIAILVIVTASDRKLTEARYHTMCQVRLLQRTCRLPP